MQHKRSPSESRQDVTTDYMNDRNTKRAKCQSVQNRKIHETDSSRGIHRHFQTALFVSPGVLIFCPQLSEIRPYPTLFVKSISPKLPSPSEHAVVNSNLDKLIALHLPKTIANAPPYSYGQPTILSRSHNPRYFVSFFPKLSDDTRKRLGQQAVSAAQQTTSAANRAVQAIVNGADAAAATSAIPLPGDVPTQGFDTEIEEYEDNGGVLVLYTRPEPSAYRIIYNHTFDIYASWKTDYCALDCEWLFAPRKWVVEGRDTPEGTTVEAKASSKVNGVVQPDDDDDMKGIFGEEPPKEAVKVEDGHTPTKWKSPHLKRVPCRGPVQPTYSSTNPSPAFVVLYANHRLNLYFSALPSFPSTTTLRSSSNDPTANLSLNSSYVKLDVLSCPILTPSVVLYESAENLPANSAKQEPGKPDSSAASSPEQPLLQQQQQQILQQQKQVTPAPFVDADSLEMGALDSAAADRLATRRKRQILPGQATVFMREEDETIWVGFRSYRPTCILVPNTSVQSASVLDDIKTNSSRVEDEGEEEDWICITELRLDLIGGVPSVSARPIPPINFPYSVYNDPLIRFRLGDFAFVDDIPAHEKVYAEAGHDRKATGDAKEGRDLSLIMLFSQAHRDGLPQGNTSRIAHYKISREDLEVSDAFAALSPTEKGSKKPDSQILSRLEWVSKEIEIKTFSNTSFTPLKAEHTGNGLNRITLLCNTSSQGNERVVSLDLNPLKISEVGPILGLDHEIMDASLNTCLMVGPSSTGSLALIPDVVNKAHLPEQVAMDVAEAFALAISNNTSYEDLLRQYQPIFKSLKGPLLDEALYFVWKILQGHDASRERKTGGDWLVPFLQLQAAVFRSTMDDRLLASTMLLHLISTENLFSRCRIDEVEKNVDGTVRPRLSYDVESLWLLLSHMEWYFALVRAIVFRVVLLPKEEPAQSYSAQSTTLDFLLSHPVTLELLQTLCKEIRRFALFVSRNSMPSAPYPGSTQTVLLLDVISTSQLQNVLRDRVEKFGVRLDAWEQILDQLSIVQEQWRKDDEAELISGQLSPARLSAVPETLAVISKHAHLVPSQLSLFESGYQTPDLLAGRDVLSKDPLNGQEIPGQLYRQCSLCHELGALWNYPAVRAYGAESCAAHWMAQWAARCICGGSWV
ncbi:hypothetical protein QFC21_001614 [Naganishia friedmannii]|uniref:Uncharacterized protein n=1 Tax=Naganishia friedmannii TaxID=89922 RepID=A0ACC2W0N9_9TREE|nr:hypothetical protein QFC21_001614 [Naganishia friedmannii]